MYSKIAFLALLASSAFALPTPQDPSLEQIAMIAGGSPPNGGAPKNISLSAIASFQGVNFLENLESAFFKEGLDNLTKWNQNGELDNAIQVVTKVHAQELIHVATAKGILSANNARTFAPCEYTFPVTTPSEFLSLANIITSTGIGAVINLVSGLALTDSKIVQGPASILAIEARHDAFFRVAALNLVPNPAPFDTRISAPYAFNLANQFIVPGSCGINAPKFDVIPPLTIEATYHWGHEHHHKVTGTGVPIKFSFDAKKVKTMGGDLFVGWVNQANKIAYSPAKLVGEGWVETVIPDGLAGIAFAALTGQQAALDVNALTPLTLAGPAPVQIS